MNNKIKNIMMAFFVMIGLTIPVEYRDVSPGRNLLFTVGKYVVNILKSISSDRIFHFIIFAGVLAVSLLYCSLQISAADKRRGILFSIPFAIMQIISADFRPDNKLDAIGASSYLVFCSLFIGLSYFFISYYVSSIGFYAFNHVLDTINESKETEKAKISLRDYVRSTVITILCWMPYYILFFPGTSNYGDTEKQIRMFFHRDVGFPLNVSPLQGPDIFITDHHPYFTTYLYGSFVKLGIDVFGNAYVGVAVFSLMQMIVVALLLSHFILRFKALGMSLKAEKISLWFVRLFPYFPVLSVCMVKDMTFSIFCVSTCAALMEVVISGGEILKKWWFQILLGMSLLLMMMSKGQGKYFVIVILVAELILYRKYYFQLCIAFIVPLVFFSVVWQGVLLNALNISPGGKQEMLGVLFQQTARYVVNYEDEVTDREKAAIDAVISYDEIMDLYDPTQTDPIKLTYKQAATAEDRKEYLKCWAAMLFKHPGVYFASTLNTSYKYFDVSWNGHPFFTYFRSRVDENDELYIHSFFVDESRSDKIYEIVLLLQGIPFIGLIFTVPFYTWASLFMFLAIAGRKGVNWTIWLLPLLSILIYFACPISLARYSQPIIMMFYPLVLFSLGHKRFCSLSLRTIE